MALRPSIPKPLADELAATYAQLDQLYLDIARNEVGTHRCRVLSEKAAIDPERSLRAFGQVAKALGLPVETWTPEAFGPRLQELQRESHALELRLDRLRTEEDWITDRAREAATDMTEKGVPWPPPPRPLQKRRDQALRGAREELSRLWLETNGIENVVWARKGGGSSRADE